MTERAAPFYCPYCGDEDLRPSEQGPSAWECESCNRAFKLSFLGLLARGLPQAPPAPEASREQHEDSQEGRNAP